MTLSTLARSAVEVGGDLVHGEQHDAIGGHGAQQARREALVEAANAALLPQPLQWWNGTSVNLNRLCPRLATLPLKCMVHVVRVCDVKWDRLQGSTGALSLVTTAGSGSAPSHMINMHIRKSWQQGRAGQKVLVGDSSCIQQYLQQ